MARCNVGDDCSTAPALSAGEPFTRECTVTATEPLTFACPDLAEPSFAIEFAEAIELPSFTVDQIVRVTYATGIQDGWIDEWLTLEALTGGDFDAPWIAAGQADTVRPDGMDSQQWFEITGANADPLACPELACTDGSGGQVALARMLFGEDGDLSPLQLWPGESGVIPGKDEFLTAHVLAAREGVCSDVAGEQAAWFAYAMTGTALIPD